MPELGSRRRVLPPPPKAVWASLVNPHLDPARPWLALLDDEMDPETGDLRYSYGQ